MSSMQTHRRAGNETSRLSVGLLPMGLLAVLAIAPGCPASPAESPASPAAPAAGAQAAGAQVTAADPGRAPAGDEGIASAQAALAPLKKNLMGTLQGALAEGGPRHAIGACQGKAPAIAAAASGAGVQVGRTSERLRNPANAPKPWMQAPLAEFAHAPRGSIPHRTYRLPEGGLGYVEPIYMQPMCLACHGESLAPEVAAALAERYPTDAATGYREGDFRGLFWVELAKQP